MSTDEENNNKKRKIDIFLESFNYSERMEGLIPMGFNKELVFNSLKQFLIENESFLTLKKIKESITKILAHGLILGEGEVYLYPNSRERPTEVVLRIGYKGLIKIAFSKNIFIKANIVKEIDQNFFEYEESPKFFIRHRPQIFHPDYNKGKILGVYAIATYQDKLFGHILNTDNINHIRNTYSKSREIWEKHWEEMAKKTVIRRLFKQLPGLESISRDDEEEEEEYVEKKQDFIKEEPIEKSSKEMVSKTQELINTFQNTKEE